jgi:DNA polymerase-1
MEKMINKILLLDADVLLYEVAHQTVRAYEVGDGKWQTIGDAKEACSRFKGRVYELAKAAGASSAILAFTSSAKNFRNGVDPNYKISRDEESLARKRPIHFLDIRKRIQRWASVRGITDNLSVSWIEEDHLEADDILGILGSNPSEFHYIICTIDKDLRTIPGNHMHLRTQEIDTVTLLEADRFFYTQILSGDPVDDIPGCKGIGKIRAARIIDEAIKVAQEDIAEDYWPTFLWDTIVSAYDKAGQSEVDALRTAQLVRILRAGEYDWDTKEVTLWKPERATLNTES